MIKNSKAIYNRVMESIAPKVKKSILNELYRDGEDEWEEAEWYKNSPEGILDDHKNLDSFLAMQAKDFMSEIGGQLPMTIEIGPGVKTSYDPYSSFYSIDLQKYEIGDKAYYNTDDRICHVLSNNFPLSHRKLEEIPIDPNKDITTFRFNAIVNLRTMPKDGDNYRQNWLIIDFQDIATKKVFSCIYYCPEDEKRAELMKELDWHRSSYAWRTNKPKLSEPSHVYGILVKRPSDRSWGFVSINVKMSIQNQKKLWAEIQEYIRTPHPWDKTQETSEFCSY